ncbi:capsule biosynthesis protein [Sphingomonas bacterium]|uniref:capsule biosynthesis protein n=1 Tax=Sphingomonas bacterium TaxID=1895847 RepID=UPI0020C73DFD|nr:capsular biosynthesis protein [Sphingomonas bacterium]
MFLDGFIETYGITDLVLYGDCRPLHHAAHGIARLRGCRIHVFEEGYIRPDFMTLERDGVNGNSTLSRDPDWYCAQAASLPPAPDLSPIPGSFERRLGETMRYHWLMTTRRVQFRHYRNHRPLNTPAEAAGWLWKWAKRPRDRSRSAAALRSLGDRPFFCLPLQLSSDAQIRIHSPFADMAVAIRYVVRSFARHAPADTVLVVKQHPLAADMVNYERIVCTEAKQAGAAARILYLERANIDMLVSRALGVVTVNSTTGTLALRQGTPTKVLGQAVYDIPRITHQGSLDAFWSHPVAPERKVYEAFCRVLRDRCLVYGGYHSDEGLDQLVEGSARRLLAEDNVAEPMPTLTAL